MEGQINAGPDRINTVLPQQVLVEPLLRLLATKDRHRLSPLFYGASTHCGWFRLDMDARQKIANPPGARA